MTRRCAGGPTGCVGSEVQAIAPAPSRLSCTHFFAVPPSFRFWVPPDVSDPKPWNPCATQRGGQ